MEYRIIEINTKSILNKFIRFPWIIYENFPKWIPPLILEIKEKLDVKKNPFFEYGWIKLLGVINKKKLLVARGAAIQNPLHNKKYNDKTGFFGLFECIQDVDAARCLFSGIKNELKKWGCDKIIGPVNFTTNEESGILINSFDKSPVFMTNYSPPYYEKLFNTCGFTKAMDMYSYGWSFNHEYPEKFKKIVKRISMYSNIRIRTIVRKQMKKELGKIREIYNTSFKDVWGFVPITQKETEEMGKAFTLFADDDLILFAEYNNKTIGFCLTLPDINEILKFLNGRLFPFGIFQLLVRRKKIKKARTMVICVHPEYRITGAVALMIKKLHDAGKAKGYITGELAVVVESNARMRDVLEKLNFTPVKTYRIFQSPIRVSGEMDK